MIDIKSFGFSFIKETSSQVNIFIKEDIILKEQFDVFWIYPSMHQEVIYPAFVGKIKDELELDEVLQQIIF